MGPITGRTKNELQQLQQQKNNSTNEMELPNIQNARHNESSCKNVNKMTT